MVLCRDYQFSTRRACGLIGFSRSSNEYRGRPDRHARIRERLVTLSGKHRRYGYRMLHAKLGQEGFKVNVKVVERLYREERLTLRRRNRKKIPKGVREGAWCPIAANQRWSLDFTMDALANGRKFRTVNLKDDCTRECPAIDVALSIPGSRVVEMLERVARERGYPDVLTVDNGPELRGRALDGWADDHGVQLYFIDPGKPTQNAYIESFNGRFREECLNLNWFTSLAEAERIIEDWRIDYNQNRPHSSLNYQTPEEFAANRPFHKPQWAATLELSDVAVVGGSEARADAEQGVEGRCGVAAAVPAEHELVEIAAQMGAAQAMEGSERPALQVREHTMDPRQHEMGERCTDDLGLVVVVGQAAITAPAIGDYPRARRRGPGNEGMKAARGEIPDRRQPDATWLALGRYGSFTVRNGRVASSISTRSSSRLRSGSTMARRSLCSRSQALL